MPIAGCQKVIGVNYIDGDDNYIDRKSGLIINIISSLFSTFAGYFFAPARILREQPNKIASSEARYWAIVGAAIPGYPLGEGCSGRFLVLQISA
jgi:hypothetical protein